MECAGGFNRFQDVDHFPRADAKCIKAVDKIGERHVFFYKGDSLIAGVIDRDVGSRHHDGFAAAGEWVWL